MRNDQATASARLLPRWVHLADVLTVLLGVAALQAALFGGFQIPGLSVRNAWRPLVMALAVAGLRHGLFRTAPMHARLWGWICRVWLTDAVRAAWTRAMAARMAQWPPMDLRFFRTLDCLVLSVVSISFTAVALLALNRFDARIAVIAGLLLATVIRCFTPARFEAERASAGKPVAPVLLLVLLTGLLFRTEPFLSLHGGQDQGVYVSMSAHLQRAGSAFMHDRLPDALPDQRSRDIYRAGVLADRERGSSAEPGLHYSPTHGDYAFQLYHLHPLWMATFAELFGDRARFHALGFFGLLGVLGLSLLAFELTGSRRAAFAAGILVATNPLHVFFSRLPASEVVALAFSSLGFYYLARAFRGMRQAAETATTATLVSLAAGCVSLVFFVRVTGFLYLPALAPLFGLGVWLTLRHSRTRGRQIIGFCTAVAALYGVSMLYGLGHSTADALSVYDRTLGNLLGDGWPLIAAGAAVLVVAGLSEVARNPRRPAVRRLLLLVANPRPWIRLASLMVAAALAGSLLQAYLIGFTDRYAEDRFQGFDIIGSGAGIFLQSGAMGWLLYVSPWLAGIAVWGMHRPPRGWPVAMLYVFLAVCMAATLLLQIPVVYQHYGYARYLLSEIVPYSLVIAIAVIFLAAPGAFRTLGLVSIAAAIPFQLFFTAKQMPVREGMQPYDVMHRIADTVRKNVLLFDVEGFRGGASSSTQAWLQTPLTHYFGLHVFPYHADTPLEDVVHSFEGLIDGHRLWLLSPASNGHPGLELYETFDYQDRRMDSAATIPVTINERYSPQTLFLYRQGAACPSPDCALSVRDLALYSLGLAYVYHRRMLGPGWHPAEEQHVWSRAQPALTLSRSWFPSGAWPAAALLEMRPFAASADNRVTLTVRSGAAERVIRFDGGDARVHEVPLACPTVGSVCTVQLEIDGTRSPRDVYGTQDGRELGIALSRIGFRF